MCFILNKEEISILSAEEDIEVAKYGLKYDNSRISALPTLTKYSFGVEKSIPKMELLEGPTYNEVITGKGLYSIHRKSARATYWDHLYRYVVGKNTRALYVGCKFVVCKAIIPKGSKYIRRAGGFVSDRLIVLDEIIPNEISLNPECKLYTELKEIFY